VGLSKAKWVPQVSISHLVRDVFDLALSWMPTGRFMDITGQTNTQWPRVAVTGCRFRRYCTIF
jgi:hypothetical protein